MQLRNLHLVNFHHFSAIAPYLNRFTRLSILVLEDCQLDRTNVLEWPKPTFQLRRLTVYFSSSPQLYPTAAQFAWLIDSSHASLRGLSLAGCKEDVYTDLLAWGSSLEWLTVIVDYGVVNGSFGAVWGDCLVEAVKLARLPSLEVLSLFGQLAEDEEASPDWYELQEAVEREVVTVNDELDRDVAAVDWW